jgi:nucleotide-binding universal stress UspA family protein
MKEPMKLLVAYDGSACSETAIEGLARAGVPANAEILVLCVTDTWRPSPTAAANATTAAFLPIAAEQNQAIAQQSIEEAETMARNAANRIRLIRSDWVVRAEACAGSPAHAILDIADSWPADLIVVGSHGRQGLDRLLMGSVSQTIATHAHCSVRVVRAAKALNEEEHLRVIIAVDGSAHADRVLQKVLEREWPAHAEMRVVCVFDPKTLAIETASPQDYDIAQNWAHRVADGAVKKLSDAGLKAMSVVRLGHPPRLLVDEADAWGADCIFLGARGLSGLGRFLLGSVSVAVMTRAHCSVEIIRPPRG